jgi:phenol hydroxylase P5 protein
VSYQVLIEPLGQSVPVEPGQTLLDACLRQGIWLPHACGHGLCGTCKVQVTRGAVDHGAANPFALMDFERDEGRCLACCATAEEDLVIEADLDEDMDAQYLPLRDHEAEVVRMEDLTPTIKGLWLKPSQALQYQAGQYLNLHLPGIHGPRAFSLANAPHEELLELHVRKVEGGPGTTWVHEALQPGQRLRFAAPLGRFYVRKSAQKPSIFLAGGSGLSSPKSMIADMLNDGSTQDIWLFQGARNRAELYFDEYFTALQATHPNFRYAPVLSDAPADDPWDGARGYVHEELKRRFDAGNGSADFRGHKAYLCGPPPMIEACIATLMQGRLFERDIHTEKFLSAADAGAPARRSPLFREL